MSAAVKTFAPEQRKKPGFTTDKYTRQQGEFLLHLRELRRIARAAGLSEILDVLTPYKDPQKWADAERELAALRTEAQS